MRSWGLVIGYADKINNWSQEYEPPCQLTEEQTSALNKALGLDWEKASNSEKDAVVLDLVWTISTQRLRRSPFENVLVSACAILGIDPRDTSWRDALRYDSFHFAAFLKIFLFMVYLRAIAAIEDQKHRRKQPTWTNKSYRATSPLVGY